MRPVVFVAFCLLLAPVLAARSSQTETLNGKAESFKIESVPMADGYSAAREVNGFQLSEAYRFNAHTGELRRHVRENSDVSTRSQSGLFLDGAGSNPMAWSKRDRVRAYTAMQEETYPKNYRNTYNGDPDGPPHDQDWRFGLQGKIQADQTAQGIMNKDDFEGDIADGDLLSIGVHALVYNLGNLTVVVYQGSYSNQDYNMDGMWWKNFIYNELPEKSRKEWVKWGQNEDDLLAPGVNANWLRYYHRAGMELTFASAKGKIDKAVEKAGIDPDVAKKEGYYALAKMIFANAVANKPAGNQVAIVGHSLGGALAILVSMYQRTLGNTYETVTFAGIGVDCLIGEQGFTDINQDIVHDQIVNYLDPMDLFTLLDTSPGTVCYWPLTTGSVEKCKLAFGYGTEIFVAPSNKADFGICRRYTHSLYHQILNANDSSILNADGTTVAGCEAIPRPMPCVTDHTYGGYVVFWIAHALVLAYLLIGLPGCIIYWRGCGCCGRQCARRHACPWCACCNRCCDAETPVKDVKHDAEMSTMSKSGSEDESSKGSSTKSGSKSN